nr:MAG TPA: hypothetical protein [Crassvirales sp.]
MERFESPLSHMYKIYYCIFIIVVQLYHKLVI